MAAALSRRGFARLLGAGVAAAALRPAGGTAPAASAPLRLSGNESPYGPCPAALEAIRAATGGAWRYPDEAIDGLRSDLSRMHGVPRDWILIGDGSSEILKLATSAFTGPGRNLVMGDPAFEAPGRYAESIGAQVVRVPLDGSFAHDLSRMSPADAGLVYLCNPNNPTASVTPRARMRTFVESARTAVLVDEAYHHYADSADYESVVPLVKAQRNLIVARTFSKIHGLAGARLGYAIAQPEVVKALAAHAAWDSVNVFAIAAGRASLASPSWQERIRKRNASTRAHVVAELGRRGFEVIPSQANFVMIDTRREVKPLIAALNDRGVQVGRLFPTLPHHLRVTLGTPEQMERFLSVFAALAA
ncbi:MAG TPA: aminotransferase class I/II-fold pyridoxal phosphate-dependent enzyme [Myxococcales bacterium]|nr:aminotransferase class I/II-fold pyridoxal phosphate-dependent enzyme [Myxococcales bacterium]